jgi:hypothetical protein
MFRIIHHVVSKHRAGRIAFVWRRRGASAEAWANAALIPRCEDTAHSHSEAA